MMNEKYVLIADDSEIDRGLLTMQVEEHYRVLEAANGKEAVDIIDKYSTDIAVLLLDLYMPVMDGFAVIEEMEKRRIKEKIPIVILTANYNDGVLDRAYEMGVSDVISKPFNPHIIYKRIHNIIELYAHKNDLEDMVKAQTRQIRESYLETLELLTSVVEFRNLETGSHIKRIKYYTWLLLQEAKEVCPEQHLTEKDIEDITEAAALHDLGKIGIPDSILLKPGKLTKEEFEVIKTHSKIGADIIERTKMENMNIGLFQYSRDICLYHHERYDGRGYPTGIGGEDIPFAAHIVALADVYDALVTVRVYKPPYTHEEAYNMILNGECGVFSPKVLECFKRAKEKFAQTGQEGFDIELNMASA